jgi:hypothetical protein
MRQDMTEQAFAQEVLAEFISWAGAVFGRIREAVTDAPRGKAAIVGVDWAGSSGSGDYTANCVPSDCGHVLELARSCGEQFKVQRARIKGLWERHGRPPVLAEERKPCANHLARPGPDRHAHNTHGGAHARREVFLRFDPH